MKSKERKNLDTFDLLKGIATVLIIFHHYQQVMECSFNGINFFGGWFYFGLLVELFFIISGLMTSYSNRFATNAGEVRYWGGCFLHKLLRLFPMVTIACAATLLLKTVLAFQLNDAEQIQKLWNVKALVCNFLLLFRGWPKLSMLGYNNPTWYICILLQCYVVFYGIHWASEKLPVKLHVKPIVLYGAFIVFSVGLFGLQILPNDNFRGYECFFMGAILGELLMWLDDRKATGKKNTNLCIMGVSSYILAILLAVAVSLRFDIALSQRRAVVFLIYPPLIVAAWYLRERFSSKAVRAFGKISFEAYLWHRPLLALFQIIIYATNWNMTHSYLSMAVFAVIVYVFAYFAYQKLEQPISRRLAKLENNKTVKAIGALD